MYLKKIKLQGFKSFAESTILEFHPGITAIVGPNGCGKSNISDAFRWVLGEQSAKSMRGGKMHDVIFAGTSKRKPLNLAEVAITLSDVRGALKTEYDELTVSRQIHRSGESNYLVNRHPVRLKDVNDLFLDSGMGKDAYSIFEQGKLDQVINLSPIERRTIFEEAAGILRFLQRKKEALSRLEQTERNSERILDIHCEVERHIVVLEKQAEKARLYQEDKKTLNALEIALAAARWSSFQKKGEALALKEEEKKEAVKEGVRGLSQKELQLQDGTIRLNHAVRELQKYKEEAIYARSQKEMEAKARRSYEERLQEMLAKEEQWKQELSGMKERQGQFKSEREQLLIRQKEGELQFLALEEERQRERQELNSLEKEMTTLSESRQTEQQGLMAFLQKENRIESELKQHLLRLEHTEERMSLLDEQQKKDQISLEEMEKSFQEKIEELKKLLSTTERYKEDFSLIERELEERAKEHQTLKSRADQVCQEKAEVKGRQNALFRLREEMEGFSKASKRLLKESSHQKSPLYQKVKGLYEVLKFETDCGIYTNCLKNWEFDKEAPQNFCLEQATIAERQGASEDKNFEAKPTPSKTNSSSSLCIEKKAFFSALMKPYGQVLVVSTLSDLREVISFVKKERLGDCSFLCLERLSGDEILEKHFFKQALVKRTLEEAFLSPGFDVWIAEEGGYVDRNQVLFFPSEGEQNIFLREAELKTLKKQQESLDQEFKVIEETLHSLAQERQALQLKKNELDRLARQEESKHMEGKYALERIEKDRLHIKQRLGKWNEERVVLGESCERLKQVIAEGSAHHAAQKKELAEVQHRLKDWDSILHEKQRALKERNQTMQLKESQYQKSVEEKRKMAHQLNVIEVKELETLQQEKRLHQEIDSLREKRASMQLQEEDLEVNLSEIEAVLKNALEKCGLWAEKESALRKEREHFESLLLVQRNTIGSLEKEQHALGIQRAQLNTSLQALEQECMERLRLTIQEICAQAENEITLNVSLEEMGRKIPTLRKKIEEAGAINLASIEELAVHRERDAFLTRQLEDLSSSKKELIEIITQLDGESRKIFKETFEKVHDNFKKNFEILFRGGEAALQFTQSGDILESGIEIVAKPPGKQMRSIHLLSGGEKCLTALALLFAIFEVKPAPFCILDEIDAPLDDANVERFLNVLKQFTDRCQFIIITHNKRTMSIADRLYGVSMQEKGVSKILSMEFGEEKVEMDLVLA